jgi:RNA polymerase sigma factor (sigma-70 family)
MELTDDFINLCKQNDRKALNELYRLLYVPLISICIRYDKKNHEGASLLNQAFLKIVQNLDQKKSEVPFMAWSKRILINIIIDQFRKESQKKVEVFYYEDIKEEVQYINYNEIEPLISQEYLTELINKLPTRTAQVFNLFVLDGYEHKEIAEALDISVSNSKWHLQSARNKLSSIITNLKLQNCFNE